MNEKIDIKAYLPQGFSNPNVIAEGKNVYSVSNQERKRVALKIVNKDTFNEEKYKRLIKLDHKGIASILEYHFIENKVIVVSEFIEGMTLYDLISEYGALSEERAKDIIIKLTQALECLHSGTEALIHRDLNPKNIIIDTSGSPVIIDLDSSRIYRDEKSQDTVAIGVIGFIAPEQFGFAQSSVQSDVYSLGVLGAYMLTGRYPTFQDNRIHIEGIGISKRFERSLNKMVSFSKEGRPSSMKSVREMLQASHINYKWLGITGMICVVVIMIFTFREGFRETSRIENGSEAVVNDALVEKTKDTGTDLELTLGKTVNSQTLTEVEPQDAIIQTSFANEFFPQLEETNIIESFEEEWKITPKAMYGTHSVIEDLQISFWGDETYFYINCQYTSEVDANVVVFLMIENESGVFGKYNNVTHLGRNDWVIKLDKNDLVESIKNHDGVITGIGIDLAESERAIMTIPMSEVNTYIE